MINDSLGFFIYTFTTIFIVVNPISGVIIFISLTSEMMHAKISGKRITKEEISQSQKREYIWIFL